MTEKYILDLLYKLNYIEIYGLTTIYFFFLYFGVGFLFNNCCKILHQKKILRQIEVNSNLKSKLNFELLHSIQSIAIFGLSGICLVYFVRIGWISFNQSSFLNTLSGILILMLWNEVHFYLIHRLLHTPLLYRKIHYIHHQSKIPSVYSVYSFHWIEALLLSTVPLSIAPFYNFSVYSIIIFPFVSILFNFAGHSNYRFGSGDLPNVFLFGTKHSFHHYKNKGNFGFITDIFDQLESKIKRNE